MRPIKDHGARPSIWKFGNLRPEILEIWKVRLFLHRVEVFKSRASKSRKKKSDFQSPTFFLHRVGLIIPAAAALKRQPLIISSLSFKISSWVHGTRFHEENRPNTHNYYDYLWAREEESKCTHSLLWSLHAHTHTHSLSLILTHSHSHFLYHITS